jgi:hypothetical protein
VQKVKKEAALAVALYQGRTDKCQKNFLQKTDENYLFFLQDVKTRGPPISK